MKEKIIFVVMCLVAFITLCAVIDSPFVADVNDPDGDFMPMGLAFVCVVTMVLASVCKPIMMVVWLVAGLVISIYCGTTAFVVYTLSAAGIMTLARFEPNVQDMIRSIWKAEEDK